MLVWKEEYSVGVKLIDGQHKRFVDLLNDFKIAVNLEIPNVDSMQKVFCDLVDYVKVHFTTEEEIQRIYEYPMQKKHFRFHSDFVEKIYDFEKEIPKIHIEDIREMSDFLNNWLIDHIMKEDKVLAKFLNEQGLQ